MTVFAAITVIFGFTAGIYHVATGKDTNIIQSIPLILLFAVYLIAHTDILHVNVSYLIAIIVSLITGVIGLIGKKKGWNHLLSNIELFYGFGLAAICVLPIAVRLFAYICITLGL